MRLEFECRRLQLFECRAGGETHQLSFIKYSSNADCLDVSYSVKSPSSHLLSEYIAEADTHSSWATLNRQICVLMAKKVYGCCCCWLFFSRCACCCRLDASAASQVLPVDESCTFVHPKKAKATLLNVMNIFLLFFRWIRLLYAVHLCSCHSRCHCRHSVLSFHMNNRTDGVLNERACLRFFFCVVSFLSLAFSLRFWSDNIAAAETRLLSTFDEIDYICRLKRFHFKWNSTNIICCLNSIFVTRQCTDGRNEWIRQQSKYKIEYTKTRTAPITTVQFPTEISEYPLTQATVLKTAHKNCPNRKRRRRRKKQHNRVKDWRNVDLSSFCSIHFYMYNASSLEGKNHHLTILLDLISQMNFQL